MRHGAGMRYPRGFAALFVGLMFTVAPSLSHAEEPAPFETEHEYAPFVTLASHTSEGPSCVNACAAAPSCAPAPISCCPPANGSCSCGAKHSCCRGKGDCCDEGCWEPTGWYASISGGWTNREDVHEIGNPATFLTWEDGFSVNGAVGYEFSFFRAEFEIGLSNTGVDQAGAGIPNVGDFVSGAQGNVSLRKYMFNLYHDFKFNDLKIVPYVGGGIGFYQSEINGLFPEFFTSLGQELNGVNATSDFPFAYQVKAGVNYEMTQRTELFLGYCFFDGNSLDFAASPFGPFRPNCATTHTMELGIRFKL